MVKVPPAISSIDRVPSRALRPKLLIVCRQQEKAMAVRQSQAGRQGQHLPHTSPPCQLSVPLTCAIQCPTQQRTFSTSAKLIWSTLRSTGTTRPFGVDTATLMS
jgi:hypothetical protein